MPSTLTQRLQSSLSTRLQKNKTLRINPPQRTTTSTTTIQYSTQAQQIINQYSNNPSWEVKKSNGRITSLTRKGTYSGGTYTAEQYTINSNGELTSYQKRTLYPQRSSEGTYYTPRLKEVRTYDTTGYDRKTYDRDRTATRIDKARVQFSGGTQELGTTTFVSEKTQQKRAAKIEAAKKLAQEFKEPVQIRPGVFRIRDEFGGVRVIYSKTKPQVKTTRQNLSTLSNVMTDNERLVLESKKGKRPSTLQQLYLQQTFEKQGKKTSFENDVLSVREDGQDIAIGRAGQIIGTSTAGSGAKFNEKRIEDVFREDRNRQIREYEAYRKARMELAGKPLTRLEKTAMFVERAEKRQEDFFGKIEDVLGLTRKDVTSTAAQRKADSNMAREFGQETLKAAGRVPFEIGRLPQVIGGRAAVGGIALITGEKRGQLKEAAKEAFIGTATTTSALRQGFDLNKPEGLVNIGLLGAGVKAVAKGKSPIPIRGRSVREITSKPSKSSSFELVNLEITRSAQRDIYGRPTTAKPKTDTDVLFSSKLVRDRQGRVIKTGEIRKGTPELLSSPIDLIPRRGNELVDISTASKIPRQRGLGDFIETARPRTRVISKTTGEKLLLDAKDIRVTDSGVFVRQGTSFLEAEGFTGFLTESPTTGRVFKVSTGVIDFTGKAPKITQTLKGRSKPGEDFSIIRNPNAQTPLGLFGETKQPLKIIEIKQKGSNGFDFAKTKSTKNPKQKLELGLNTKSIQTSELIGRPTLLRERSFKTTDEIVRTRSTSKVEQELLGTRTKQASKTRTVTKSRSGSLSGLVLGSQSKTREKLSLEGLSLTKQKTRQATELGLGSFVAGKTISGTANILGSQTRQLTKQKNILQLISLSGTGTGRPSRPRGGDPFDLGRTPKEVTGIIKPKLGGDPFGFVKKGKRRARRFQYTPDLTATLYRERGKRSKGFKGLGIFSGLERRKIPKF